jgi:hypothetical protein
VALLIRLDHGVDAHSVALGIKEAREEPHAVCERRLVTGTTSRTVAQVVSYQIKDETTFSAFIAPNKRSGDSQESLPPMLLHEGERFIDRLDSKGSQRADTEGIRGGGGTGRVLLFHLEEAAAKRALLKHGAFGHIGDVGVDGAFGLGPVEDLVVEFDGALEVRHRDLEPDDCAK